MKYVISEIPGIPGGSLRPKHIAIFSENLIHASMVPQGYVALSAGECLIRTVDSGHLLCTVSGGSDSLGLVCDEFADGALLSTWLNFGESMLIMASMQYDEDAKPKRRKKNVQTTKAQRKDDHGANQPIRDPRAGRSGED